MILGLSDIASYGLYQGPIYSLNLSVDRWPIRGRSGFVNLQSATQTREKPTFEVSTLIRKDLELDESDLHQEVVDYSVGLNFLMRKLVV